MNVSADIDDNRDDDERLLNQALDDAELLFCANDDERLLNEALDDVEQLFCVDDDDELVRLANALNSDQQQQQQQTTTIPRQYLLASIS